MKFKMKACLSNRARWFPRQSKSRAMQCLPPIYAGGKHSEPQSLTMSLCGTDIDWGEVHVILKGDLSDLPHSLSRWHESEA
jgi:hypothetical protein